MHGGARDADSHSNVLVALDCLDYLISYFYLREHPTSLSYLVRTGMIKRQAPMKIVERKAFGRVGNLEKMKGREVRLMLDSGAFTAWSKGTAINLDEYIKYIKANISDIDTYFNLDVIPGKPGVSRTQKSVDEAAAQSYSNLKAMRKAGLSPIPVFHQGESFYWLDKLLDDGYKYIALGGLGGQSETDSLNWLDHSWTRLTTNDGKPIIKVHGLGVASFSLLKRYPWFSCDATSWALTAAYGSIFVPVYRMGKPDYSLTPVKLSVSTVERKTGMPPDHYLRYGPIMRKRVEDFLQNHVGISPQEAAEDYVQRARAIVYFYLRFQDAIGDQPFKYRRKTSFT